MDSIASNYEDKMRAVPRFDIKVLYFNHITDTYVFNDGIITSSFHTLAKDSPYYFAIKKYWNDIKQTNAKNAETINVAQEGIAQGGKVIIDNVLKERQGSYGFFKDNAKIAQGLKALARSGVNYHKLTDTQKEALDQTLSKISRMVTGDPAHKDNHVDIIGYNQLALDELNGIYR